MPGIGAELGPAGSGEPGKAVEQAQAVFTPVFLVTTLTGVWRTGCVELRDSEAIWCK